MNHTCITLQSKKMDMSFKRVFAKEETIFLIVICFAAYKVCFEKGLHYSTMTLSLPKKANTFNEE